MRFHSTQVCCHLIIQSPWSFILNLGPAKVIGLLTGEKWSQSHRDVLWTSLQLGHTRTHTCTRTPLTSFPRNKKASGLVIQHTGLPMHKALCVIPRDVESKIKRKAITNQSLWLTLVIRVLKGLLL